MEITLRESCITNDTPTLDDQAYLTDYMKRRWQGETLSIQSYKNKDNLLGRYLPFLFMSSTPKSIKIKKGSTMIASEYISYQTHIKDFNYFRELIYGRIYDIKLNTIRSKIEKAPTLKSIAIRIKR